LQACGKITKAKASQSEILQNTIAASESNAINLAQLEEIIVSSASSDNGGTGASC